MDFNVLISCASMLLLAMACLVFAVNIIIEVIKKNFTKIPTTLLATVVSLVLTLIAFFAWASYSGLTVWWYHIAGAVILGLFVAYAAMFGFDKFKQAFEKLKNYKQ